jgi:hypothetical protein
VQLYSNAGINRHVLRKKSDRLISEHAKLSGMDHELVIVAVMSNLQYWMRMATRAAEHSRDQWFLSAEPAHSTHAQESPFSLRLPRLPHSRHGTSIKTHTLPKSISLLRRPSKSPKSKSSLWPTTKTNITIEPRSTTQRPPSRGGPNASQKRSRSGCSDRSNRCRIWSLLGASFHRQCISGHSSD